MKTHSPDIVPQAVAAKVLGVTRQAVRYWVDRGHVTRREVHGEIWVSLADCKRWTMSPKTRKRKQGKEAAKK